MQRYFVSQHYVPMSKEFIRSSADAEPAFGLYFRRYAPFDTFGGGTPAAIAQRSDGDGRTAASTSLKVTARTYGCVMFNSTGVIYNFAGSTGSTAHTFLWGDAFAYAKVATTVVDNPIFHGPRSFLVSASTSSAFPLTPAFATPAIDTYVKAFIDFSIPKTLRVSGSAWGDNFPNLEVFLRCYRSTRSALLIDGRTTGSKDFGPVTRLIGKNEDNPLGTFTLVWPLSSKGEALHDSKVEPSSLGDYPYDGM